MFWLKGARTGVAPAQLSTRPRPGESQGPGLPMAVCKGNAGVWEESRAPPNGVYVGEWLTVKIRESGEQTYVRQEYFFIKK